METFVGITFIVVCFLLIIVVLLQKGRGGGLGAAFGGAGSSAFGTRTGDVFTWVTIVLTIVFLLLAIGATVLYRPGTGDVLMPTFSEEAEISGPTSVTIECTTSNSRIAYTIDGTDPVEEQAKRTGSVHAQVKPGQTLKARAFRKNWTDSPIAVQKFTKKKPKPPTTQSVPPSPTSKPATAPAGASGGGE